MLDSMKYIQSTDDEIDIIPYAQFIDKSLNEDEIYISAILDLTFDD